MPDAKLTPVEEAIDVLLLIETFVVMLSLVELFDIVALNPGFESLGLEDEVAPEVVMPTLLLLLTEIPLEDEDELRVLMIGFDSVGGAVLDESPSVPVEDDPPVVDCVLASVHDASAQISFAPARRPNDARNAPTLCVSASLPPNDWKESAI